MNANLHARIYRSLLRVRRVEEEVARVYPTDKIKSPVHLSIGQEAVAVGICEVLRPDDIAFGTYRGHATYLAKGGDLKKMIAELYGKTTGCSKGKGGSMHLIDTAAGVMGTSAVVATTIPHAVGYAWSLKLLGRDSVVVSFFGDGAVEEGAFHESLNFAVLKRVPVLFVCENNFYAIHSHQRVRQPLSNIYERVRAYGMPSERVDDGDVFAIYERAKAAVAEIRSGCGPRFLECFVYRWKEHVGPGDDFHVGYRSRSEGEPWFERDPVRRVGEMLPPEVREAIEREVMVEVRDAFEFAERSPFPDSSELYADMFKETRHAALADLR